MQSGMVQELGKTANNNPKIKLNGKWYFLDREITTTPTAGQIIEIKEAQFEMGGKTFDKITAWRPLVQPATSAPSARPAIMASPQLDYLDEASLRFISNAVGSSITAGTIDKPEQIHAWFEAARMALAGKPYQLQNQAAPALRNHGPVPGVDDRGGFDDEFNDSIPEWNT
jgi:hypothetical protein